MARVLLVNPPIYDFAAFDLWAKPLGALYIGAFLRDLGHDVRIVDALDRLHPALQNARGKHAPKSRPYGTGSYYWREVEKPFVYRGIRRIYRRFGLPEDLFGKELAAGEPPDVIGVTSAMTYWYPGVAEAVRTARDVFPGVPVVLGGVYATLCSEHAREVIGPDFLVEGPGEDAFARIVAGVAGGPAPEGTTPFRKLPAPAYDLLPHFDSVSVLSGRGCPYRCAYCASAVLTGEIERRSPRAVADEIESYRRRFGVEDAAFFDDALLWDADNHAKPLFEEIIRRRLGMRFHTPNGLHVGMIDADLARLMREAGFVTLRLSLETVDRTRGADWDGKVDFDEFLAAVSRLTEAGFTHENMGAYVMTGLPGESFEEGLRNVAAAHSAGVKVRLAQYSPIPGTRYFERALAASSLDIREPLCQNNSIVAAGGDRAFERLESLKRVAGRLNDALAEGRLLVTHNDLARDVGGVLRDAGVIDSE